ncbi:MAG: M20/M25/M40 family metallo-hydrolase [Planctomycetes bacterium]|nr:M20/M25/M40 family metallo-hydrolase [Planctomycetota bacterium]
MLASITIALWAQHVSVEPIDFAAYHYGQNVTLRDALIRQGDMFDDLGTYVIGEFDENLIERFDVECIDLPDLNVGEEMFTILAHPDHADQALIHLGRSLWNSPNGLVQLRALTKAQLASVSGPIFQCHGAVRKIGVRAITPTQFNGGSVNAITPNANIQAMVAQVSQSNLETDVATLEAFGTRRHGQQGEVNAENWLVARLNALGMNTTTFDYDSGADVVIGEFIGTTDPSKIVVIGAHYDSINYAGSSASAPGADDDASGTAAVLEIARVLAQQQYDYTIRFCAWSGEESGLLGSEAYAAHLQSIGANVIGMVQLDMIAYRAPGDSRSVDFVTNDTDPGLNAFAMDAYQAYVPSLPVTIGYLSGGTSDHRSFFQHGFPSTFPFEDLGSYSPYIHGYNDVSGTSANDFTLAKLITQGALATVAELARPLSMTLSHTSLPDTQDEAGPYVVNMDVVSNTAATINGATLYWKLDSDTSFNAVTMQPNPAFPSTFSGAIPGQVSPARVEYYMTAIDSAGNEKWLPDGFSAGSDNYRFHVGLFQSIYFDDFDGSSDNGWTHAQIATQDDWQRGTPQGNAGDPSGAYSGAKSWSNDLGNSGWNGEYAANVHNTLTSPVIDCSGKTGVTMTFARWLTVEENQYDQAEIRVNGNLVWSNPSSNLMDTSWSIQDIDISAYADNNAAVQIEFKLKSDGGVEFGGWNIDDFEVYTLGGSGGSSDALNLTGSTIGQRGQAVNYTLSNMQPNASFGLLVSLSNSGSSIFGHSFDIGSPYTIVHTGNANASGSAVVNFTIPMAVASNTIAYVEGGAQNGAGVDDSNLLTLLIQ